jgi:hypothetical protein
MAGALLALWQQLPCRCLMPLLRAAAQVLQKNPLLIRHAQENDTPVRCCKADAHAGTHPHMAPAASSITFLSGAACAACATASPLPNPCMYLPAKRHAYWLLRAVCSPCLLPASCPQFEPVYMDADGNWMAPSLNYMEKRTDWQAYIDKNVFKQE